MGAVARIKRRRLLPMRLTRHSALPNAGRSHRSNGAIMALRWWMQSRPLSMPMAGQPRTAQHHFRHHELAGRGSMRSADALTPRKSGQRR